MLGEHDPDADDGDQHDHNADHDDSDADEGFRMMKLSQVSRQDFRKGRFVPPSGILQCWRNGQVGSTPFTSR